ncbi:MAG: cupredoxin domain-containing protein [Rhodobacteraceae bacterium]|nr:cupredoxin domain-containing protein [Paracoccaceae bacterium]
MNFSSTSLVFGLLIALAATPALASGTHSGGHSDGPNIGQKGKASQVSRTIEIGMGEMYFDPDTLAIKKGETIRFVVTNKGEFVHEFNIATTAMHEAHQSEMIEMMDKGILEAERINHDLMKSMGMMHEDANSALLEPGKVFELIWTFDGDAALEISCNVPGHRESGMVGKIDIN